MKTKKSFVLTLCCFALVELYGQFPSWHCANLGARIHLDEKLIKGDLTLPDLSLEEFKCLGEFYANQDLKNKQYLLLESSSRPQYGFNGYSICSLEKYEITYQRIGDLLHEKPTQEKICAFIDRYNEIVFATYRKIIPPEEMKKILAPPSVIDPYTLKARLSRLKLKEEALINIDPQSDNSIVVKLDVRELFEGIDIPIDRLRFIVIDENTNARVELSMKDLSQKGVVLQTIESRKNSIYWYDFRIRVGYDALAEEGLVVSCEKTEDYYFHFEHLSVTKDFRLINHEH